MYSHPSHSNPPLCALPGGILCSLRWPESRYPGAGKNVINTVANLIYLQSGKRTSLIQDKPKLKWLVAFHKVLSEVHEKLESLPISPENPPFSRYKPLHALQAKIHIAHSSMRIFSPRRALVSCIGIPLPWASEGKNDGAGGWRGGITGEHQSHRMKGSCYYKAKT